MPSLSELGQAYEGPIAEQTWLQKLAQTWPAKLAQSAWSAAKLPGDVYQGKVDPLAPEGIERAADLAGMVMGGTFAGAPAKAAGETVLGAGPIKAYHGSPHDFDRFDISRIGTGEGAQAYGHGLYFAEQEATAKAYRDALGWKPQMDTPEGVAQYWIQNAGGDKAAAAKELAQLQKTWAHVPEMASMYGKAAEIIPTLEPKSAGRMYEVAIHADPERFLDWDKPLFEQPKNVRTALEQFRGIPEAEPLWSIAGNLRTGLPGESAVRQLNKAIGPVEATERLRQADVPGIRYFDQGSRLGPKDNASRNYVVFDDKLIDILRKYGLAGAAPLGALGSQYEQPAQ